VGIEYVGWEAWGAKAKRDDLTDQRVTKSGIVFVHHSEGTEPKKGLASEIAVVRSIEDFHMNVRGWTAIAYSWLVAPSGRIFLGRGFGHVPAAQYGANSGNGAICVLGSYDDHGVTWAARKSIIALARTFPGAYLGGHRDVTATDCPGDALYAQLGRIRFWSQKKKPNATVARIAGLAPAEPHCECAVE